MCLKEERLIMLGCSPLLKRGAPGLILNWLHENTSMQMWLLFFFFRLSTFSQLHMFCFFLQVLNREKLKVQTDSQVMWDMAGRHSLCIYTFGWTSTFDCVTLDYLARTHGSECVHPVWSGKTNWRKSMQCLQVVGGGASIYNATSPDFLNLLQTV